MALILCLALAALFIPHDLPFFGGTELNLAVGAMALAVLIGGPGRYSLDAELGLTRRRWWPSRR